jgi:hypothetical protein
MKITKLPAAPQETFFQEHQFDPDIGEGTDPQHFLNGRTAVQSGAKKGRARQQSDSTGFKESKTRAAKQARKAAQAVKGHPKEKEILAVLRGAKHE